MILSLSPLIGKMLPVQKGKREGSIGGFNEQLSKAIDQLNNSQLKADEISQKFLTGEVCDLHQVVLAMGEAKLTMQLAVEVRNKMIESYREISRMQV